MFTNMDQVNKFLVEGITGTPNIDNIKKNLKQELNNSANKYNATFYERGFSDTKALTAYAEIKLSDFIEDLTTYLEIDIYNNINFTCDYILYCLKSNSCCETQPGYISDAIKFWSDCREYDEGEDEITRLVSNFVRNYKKLDPKIPGFVSYDESTGNITVLELCSALGLYVFENYKDVFWYNNETNIKYLLSRFLKIDNYELSETEYFIFENLTNINSAIVIASALLFSVPKEAAERLATTDTPTRFRMELNDLIDCVAKSKLIYSKSYILQILFEKAAEEIDFTGELNIALRYVRLQFSKISAFFENYVCYESYNRFYKFGTASNEKNIFEHISKQNHKTFCKNFLNNYTVAPSKYQANKLIKDGNTSPCFNGLTKLHCIPSYINAYIQKMFVLFINSEEEPPTSSLCEFFKTQREKGDESQKEQPFKVSVKKVKKTSPQKI